MVWLTEMYQLKRQCIEGIWFYAQLVLQVEYHFHGPWFTWPHALAHLQSNILSSTDNVRDTKKFTIYIKIHHMTSCEWWRCGPIILPSSLITHHITSCDKNCGLFYVSHYRRVNAVPYHIHMFHQRIPLDPKDFFFFFFQEQMDNCSRYYVLT